ncbi:hypothetical protein [Ferroplasma sp.]|nr:hypothetical protein [Ferroplasma sp.]MCL4454001.1 hypothetical protein [Candidatus Thermoplasmatota archaeon]
MPERVYTAEEKLIRPLKYTINLLIAPPYLWARPDLIKVLSEYCNFNL